MKLIFEGGEVLYNKQQRDILNLKSFANSMDLTCYHKTLIRGICNEVQNSESNFSYSIYGDDFKIGIVPRNVLGNCAFNIKDYDENQKLEREISINFNKQELDQLINLLQIIHSDM